MIEKCGPAVADFLAGRASAVLDGHALDLFSTMLTHEMKNPVCLCQGFIRAAGALETGRILLGMFGGNMNRQSLGMQKLLLACRATVR